MNPRVELCASGYPFTGSYFAPYSYPQAPQFPTTLPEGTLLHKDFYNLLWMIPTPSPPVQFGELRLGFGHRGTPGSAGPRYEEIKPGVPPSSPGQRTVGGIQADTYADTYGDTLCVETHSPLIWHCIVSAGLKLFISWSSLSYVVYLFHCS
jgi:hypothetical protein